MARTNVPLTNLTVNNVIDIPAGTSLDPTNGHNIALASTAIPAGSSSDNLFLYVTNTAGSDKTLTVKAGVVPPSFRKDLGDLTVTIHTASGGGVVGPLEPARFLQADGSINVDLQAASAGKITAFLKPRTY